MRLGYLGNGWSDVPQPVQIFRTGILPDGEADSLAFAGWVVGNLHEPISLLGIGRRLFLCGRMYVDDLSLRPLFPLDDDRAYHRSRNVAPIFSFEYILISLWYFPEGSLQLPSLLVLFASLAPTKHYQLIEGALSYFGGWKCAELWPVQLSHTWLIIKLVKEDTTAVIYTKDDIFLFEDKFLATSGT